MSRQRRDTDDEDIDFVQYNHDHVTPNSQRINPRRQLSLDSDEEEQVSPRKQRRLDFGEPSGLYDNMNNGSDDDQEMQQDSTQRSDSTVTNRTVRAANPALKEAAGVAAPSGDSVNPGFTIIRMPFNNAQNTFTFKNTFMCNTWGYAYKTLGDGNDNFRTITTPLCAIPTNYLGLYMTKQDYALLPAAAVATNCRIKVMPKGFRTSFATQETGSTYSNSNHTLFGVSAIGLNCSSYGEHYTIASASATDPMSINQMQVPTVETLYERLWGKPCATAAQQEDFFNELPTCIGVHRSIPYYYGLNIAQVNANATGERNQVNVGFPKFRQKVSEWDFAGRVNQNIITYKHKFKNGILKTRDAFIHPISQTGENGAVEYYNSGLYYSSKYKTNKQGNLVDQNAHAVQKTPQTKLDFNSNIEKAWMSRLNSDGTAGQKQPFVYFGIQPIPANYPATGTTSYTNVQAVWLVECEIDVVCYPEAHFTASDKISPWLLGNYGDKIYTADNLLQESSICNMYRKT